MVLTTMVQNKWSALGIIYTTEFQHLDNYRRVQVTRRVFIDNYQATATTDLCLFGLYAVRYNVVLRWGVKFYTDCTHLQWAKARSAWWYHLPSSDKTQYQTLGSISTLGWTTVQQSSAHKHFWCDRQRARCETMVGKFLWHCGVQSGIPFTLTLQNPKQHC